MDQAFMTHPDRVLDQKKLRALVGWTHAALPHGVDLRIQCTASTVALEHQQVETQHLLMTRNQALLLAKYLLDVTGQTLPSRHRPSFFGRFWRGAR
jgi:hypothetical protein